VKSNTLPEVGVPFFFFLVFFVSLAGAIPITLDRTFRRRDCFHFSPLDPNFPPFFFLPPKSKSQTAVSLNPFWPSPSVVPFQFSSFASYIDIFFFWNIYLNLFQLSSPTFNLKSGLGEWCKIDSRNIKSVTLRNSCFKSSK